MLCSKCHTPVAGSAFNTKTLQPCGHCRALLQTEVFPAFYKDGNGILSNPTAAASNEAGCFYHPHKKAVVPCGRCGRFLCDLCDMAMEGGHFCPACLASGRKKNVFRNLENHRVLYDSIALGLALYPLLLFYLTLITAPIAIYTALRYWNAPGSIIRRTKIRYVAALIISAAQLGGWLTGVYFLLRD